MRVGRRSAFAVARQCRATMRQNRHMSPDTPPDTQQLSRALSLNHPLDARVARKCAALRVGMVSAFARAANARLRRNASA